MPLVTHADLVRDQLAHLPFGTRRPPGAATPVRVGVVGTGGELLVLGWSAADLARERAAGVRILRALGVVPGMRVANALPGALTTPGSLLLGDVVEELGGLDVPLGTVDGDGTARAAWELIDRVQPEVVVLADATALFAATPTAPRPWWRGIVWLRTESTAPRAAVPAAAGFAGWQRTWLGVPEATSFIAAECAASRLHADERVVVEVVDPRTGAALEPGRDGILAVTAPDLGASPVRYATALAARVAATSCPCGAGGVVLEMAG